MKTSDTLQFEATEHATAIEALQYLDVSGHDEAMLVGGRFLTMNEREAEKLAASGIAAAYIGTINRIVDGKVVERICTIPINDDGPDAIVQLD